MKEQVEKLAERGELKSLRTESTSTPGVDGSGITNADAGPDNHDGDCFDEAAACYEANFTRLRERGRARGLHDPEAVVQVVFLSLLARGNLTSKAIRYLPYRHFCRCNSALAKQMARGRRESPLTPEIAEFVGAIDREFELSIARDEVRVALSRLSPSHRSALIQHYLHDRDVEEVAADCGTTPEAIKSLLFRARRQAHAVILGLRNISRLPQNQTAGAGGFTNRPEYSASNRPIR